MKLIGYHLVKMSTFSGNVNYDLPFMVHIGTKKDKMFAQKLRARYIMIDRW